MCKDHNQNMLTQQEQTHQKKIQNIINQLKHDKKIYCNEIQILSQKIDIQNENNLHVVIAQEMYTMVLLQNAKER